MFINVSHYSVDPLSSSRSKVGFPFSNMKQEQYGQSQILIFLSVFVLLSSIKVLKPAKSFSITWKTMESSWVLGNQQCCVKTQLVSVAYLQNNLIHKQQSYQAVLLFSCTVGPGRMKENACHNLTFTQPNLVFIVNSNFQWFSKTPFKIFLPYLLKCSVTCKGQDGHFHSTDYRKQLCTVCSSKRFSC